MLYAANCWEWIVSYFAIARVGAVINPANTMLTPTEIEYIVNNCGAKAIITSAEKAPAIMGVKEGSAVGSIVAFGGAAEGVASFDDLIARDLAPPPLPNIAPESMSTIGYTSGTTGHPKGAM